ncbi:MAG: GMC family oxidoreductase [Phormidesmis sp.]
MNQLTSNYDYIVIGAGSAGSMVAAKLASADSATSVLLIEAGGAPSSPQMYRPSDWFDVLQKNTEIGWKGYQSVPQPALSNRVIQLKQAKVLGGCALHNATVYVRGSKSDFDSWGKVAAGWSWDDVLPHFENVEKVMEILIGEPDSFVHDLFVAAQEYGLPKNPNYNTSESQYGYSLLQFNNSRQGANLFRETTFSTYLQTIPNNLTLISHAFVSRILFDRDSTAIGIEYVKDNEKYAAYVNNEIILSAGAISTPKILMLSGIGDEKQLKRFSIPVVANIAEVGRNLHDDLFVSAGFSIPEDKPLPNYPYSLAPAVIFGSTQNDDANIDIESSVGVGSLKGFLGPRYSFWLWPNVMHSKSKGTVTLRSDNPDDPPLIDPGYLSMPEDLQKCKEALQFGLDIGNKLVGWKNKQISPEPDADLEHYIRTTADTTHHFCGTCRMGDDADSVVDTQLRVRDTSGLRIVDSSVFPLPVTANTAAATMMIADKAVDSINALQ